MELPTRASYEAFLSSVKLEFCQKKPLPGLVLLSKCDAYQLEPLDRVHHGGSIQTLGDVFRLTTFPAKIFFIRTKGAKMNSICPLFAFPGLWTGVLGFTVSNIQFDMLHTCDLGVCAHLVGTILAAIIDDSGDLLQTGRSAKQRSRGQEASGDGGDGGGGGGRARKGRRERGREKAGRV